LGAVGVVRGGMNVTPLEILALAETRRRDPDLALSIAEQSGKAHDQITRQPLALIGAETKDNSNEQASPDAKASPDRRKHVRG
jgi:hypothetical protein